MTYAPFSSEVYRKLKKCTHNVMFKWNWRKTSHVHADLDMVATARGFWNSLTNWIIMDSTHPSQPSPASTYLFMLSASHVQCASWFSIAFGCTRWRGLSGGLAPFVPRVFMLNGGVKNFGKFLWLDSLKCNFLHSLDHNWLTRKVF